MNVVYPNLNRHLVEVGISFNELSDATGIELNSLEKKMQGVLPFKLTEVVRVCIYLKCPNAKYLFLQLDNNIY